jgi:hypothetical protein
MECGGNRRATPTSSPPSSTTFRPRASKQSATNKKTFESIEPPWQAIKEWIPNDEPDLNWFYQLRKESEPDHEWFDQSPAWQAPEVPLVDGRILVLEFT